MAIESTLQQLTSESKTLLEQCVALKPLTHEQWAQGRLTDLNLWASDMGVFAKGDDSPVKQLCDSPESLEIFKALLAILQSSLQKFIDLGSAIERGELEQRIHDTLESQDATDVPTSVSHPEWSWSNRSDTSQSLNPGNQDDQLRSTDPMLPLLGACSNVEGLLDRLIDLRVLIRPSGRSSKMLKPDMTFRSEEYLVDTELNRRVRNWALDLSNYQEAFSIPEESNFDFVLSNPSRAPSPEKLLSPGVVSMEGLPDKMIAIPSYQYSGDDLDSDQNEPMTPRSLSDGQA